MDVGGGADTKFEYSEKVLDAYENNPSLETNSRNGLIHSHNNMGVSFSQTDIEELEDNHEHYNGYLSMIVNNDGNMAAKIAFVGKIKENIEIEDLSINTTRDSSIMFIVNLIVSIEQSPEIEDEFFTDRVEEIIEASKVPSRKIGYQTPDDDYSYYGSEYYDRYTTSKNKSYPNPAKTTKFSSLIKAPAVSKEYAATDIYAILNTLLSGGKQPEGTLLETLNALEKTFSLDPDFGLGRIIIRKDYTAHQVVMKTFPSPVNLIYLYGKFKDVLINLMATSPSKFVNGRKFTAHFLAVISSEQTRLETVQKDAKKYY